ncbi:MAG: hypothetical protein Q4C96_05420 [Planctomycetia bacterium]|nr:hypothetical protein [Planctomycetia bacterium]
MGNNTENERVRGEKFPTLCARYTIIFRFMCGFGNSISLRVVSGVVFHVRVVSGTVFHGQRNILEEWNLW